MYYTHWKNDAYTNIYDCFGNERWQDYIYGLCCVIIITYHWYLTIICHIFKNQLLFPLFFTSLQSLLTPSQNSFCCLFPKLVKKTNKEIWLFFEIVSWHWLILHPICVRIVPDWELCLHLNRFWSWACKEIQADQADFVYSQLNSILSALVPIPSYLHPWH